MNSTNKRKILTPRIVVLHLIALTMSEMSTTPSQREQSLQFSDLQLTMPISDTDKMYVDLRLKQDATAAAKKKASKAKNSRKRPRRNRLEPEDDEETGLHFTAYVPAGGHVWCMDGMEATPRDLGMYFDVGNQRMY